MKKFRLKVGDRVIYRNPLKVKSGYEGKKAIVKNVWKKSEIEEKEWHGYAHKFNLSVKFDHEERETGSYVDCVFQLDNSSVIKEKLGVK